MAEPDPESDPKAFIGKELKLIRLAAGFTSQEALADRIGYDRTLVVKIERGTNVPTEAVVKAWCAACGVSDELYLRMAVLARKAGGPVPAWFDDYLAAEATAQFLRIWSPLLIPGLFQTAEYARALFLAEQTDTSDDHIDALVEARLKRQEILERSDAPEVIAVLDESVLYRLIGSPAITREALQQAAILSERPNISVQVVPGDNGANAGLGGAFHVISADGATEIVSMIGLEDQATEKRSLVHKGVVTFDRLRGDALSRTASRNLILKVAEERWSQ